MGKVASLGQLRSRVLPPGVLAADVAETSRIALVAFLRMDGDAAARPQLASWLFGTYLDAIELGRRSAIEQPTLVLDDILRDETAAEAVAKTTLAIERVLRAFVEDPEASIATRLLERRVVEAVVDDQGNAGFAPLGETWMTLGVRVLALLGVEMLARPDRLRADIVIDGTSVTLADRAVVSGVGLRGRRTLPWKPSADERARSPGWPSTAPTLAELAAAQDRRSDDE